MNIHLLIGLNALKLHLIFVIHCVKIYKWCFCGMRSILSGELLCVLHSLLFPYAQTVGVFYHPFNFHKSLEITENLCLGWITFSIVLLKQLVEFFLLFFHSCCPMHVVCKTFITIT